MRRCRFCKEEIADSSRVCEHCDRNLITGIRNVSVTTGDLQRAYDIIGPVYVQLSNKGLFSSTFSKLLTKHTSEIEATKRLGQVAGPRADWGFLYGEYSVGQTVFDQAFFVAVQELKARAGFLGADAIIGMRQDIDLDTTAFQFFYLQMYGTAVKFKDVESVDDRSGASMRAVKATS